MKGEKFVWGGAQTTRSGNIFRVAEGVGCAPLLPFSDQGHKAGFASSSKFRTFFRQALVGKAFDKESHTRSVGRTIERELANPEELGTGQDSAKPEILASRQVVPWLIQSCFSDRQRNALADTAKSPVAHLGLYFPSPYNLDCNPELYCRSCVRDRNYLPTHHRRLGSSNPHPAIPKFSLLLCV
jgi:hypothetical protein